MAGILAALGAVGCSPQPKPQAEEASLTSGRISIVCAPEAQHPIARELSAFQSLYPQAQFEMRLGSSREAVGALFAAECDLAVITRDLNVDERAAAVRGGLELEGYRFARDALVALVHPDNPVENLGVDEMAAIYAGHRGRWSDFGGPSVTIIPVIPPPESDLTESLISQVMADSAIRARVLVEPGDSAVVERVKRTSEAIGVVSLRWVDRGARALRLAPMSGLPYWAPDAEAVYRDQYPLVRFFNLYVRAGGPPLASGFITYVTSREGQALVREAGLVPTAVPVRFVRRSPMLGSH